MSITRRKAHPVVPAEAISNAAKATAPDDFAAHAEALRRDASAARDRAAGFRSTAKARIEEAEAAAARVMDAAKAGVATLTDEAVTADREAKRLDEQALPYVHAARCEQQAAEAQNAADVLAAERDDLAGKVTGLTERIGRYSAERADLQRQRADALERFDETAAGALQGDVGTKTAMIGEAERQREPLRARLAAIGGGTGRGELAAALTVVKARQAELRQALNVLDPERYEALMDEFLATIQANQERIAEETAQAAGRPRTLIARGR